MGMDVFDKNTTSEKGGYFRNNVWWWRPLWMYCEAEHADIVNGVENAQYNDGAGLDADGAYKLGVALLADVESGKTKEWGDEYRAWQDSLPMVPCSHCGATGIRTDEVGQDMGMPTRELDAEDAEKFGRTHGWCNGCCGAGETKDWACSYPFDSENVKAFAEFCVDSGGFEIW